MLDPPAIEMTPTSFGVYPSLFSITPSLQLERYDLSRRLLYHDIYDHQHNKESGRIPNHDVVANLKTSYVVKVNTAAVNKLVVRYGNIFAFRWWPNARVIHIERQNPVCR